MTISYNINRQSAPSAIYHSLNLLIKPQIRQSIYIRRVIVEERTRFVTPTNYVLPSANVLIKQILFNFAYKKDFEGLGGGKGAEL